MLPIAARVQHVMLVIGAVTSSVFETGVSSYTLRYVGSVHEGMVWLPIVTFSQQFPLRMQNVY